MFARKINVYIARTLVVALVNIVNLYFIANYMGPKPLGLIGFASSYIQIFFLFADLGFGQAHIKRISEGKNQTKCVNTYFFLKGSLLLILLLVIITSLIVKKHIFHSNFSEPDQERVIYLLIVVQALIQISSIPIKTFEAKKESAKASIADIVASLIKAPITILVAVLGFGVYGLIFSRTIGAIAVVAISFSLLREKIHKPDKILIKSYFGFAYKVFIINIIANLAYQLDRIMIGTFVSTEAVGYYYSIQLIIAMLAVVPNAAGTLLFPIFSEEHAKGSITKILEYTSKSEKYIGLLMIPITVFIAFYSKTIIFIFLGKEFSISAVPLTILSIFVLVDGLRKPVASILPGIDKMGTLAILATISVIINIILNVLFIPEELLGIKLGGMGINGAALSTLIAGVIYSLSCRITVYRIFKLKPNKSIYLQYFSGFLLFSLLYSLTLLHPIPTNSKLLSLGILIIYGSIGFLFHYGFLWIMKVLTKDDMMLLFDSLRLTKMKRYFQSEIKNKL